MSKFLVVMAASVFGAVGLLSARPVTLVADAKPLAKIYVSSRDLGKKTAGAFPPREIPYVALAVEDLNYHLGRMAGAKLEVVETDDEKVIKGPALVLGSLADKLGCVVEPTKWSEGYRILVRGQQVLIQGEKPQGVSYGIYSLLGKLGCDWVMPGKLGEIIPNRPTVEVPAMDERSAPDFGMRELWYRGGAALVTEQEVADFELWKRRQRLGVAEALRYNGTGHEWHAIIDRHKAAFDADPEMLALVRQPDGSLARKGPQLEVTNPKLVELVVEDIRQKFTSAGWP